MTGTNEVRLGIVGCGSISHAHAAAAQQTEKGIRFVACCDLHRETAAAWAVRYGCDGVYTDYEEMLRTEELDGVLLATWPDQHREQVENCLELGARYILCEKALTLTGAEAVEIHDLVASANALVMEGFMYRHHPAIRKMEERLATGELGAVDSVRAHFSAYDDEAAPATDKKRNWRQRKECGGGIPYDFACYCVNACGHFAGGLPVRVYCRGNVSAKYDTVNRVYALIEYGNGCVGLVESSKKADTSQELQVVCAHGRLTLPIAWTCYAEIEVCEQHSTGWVAYDTRNHRLPQTDSYQMQLENFAAVLRGKAEPVLPLAQSVVNTFAVEALVTSLLEQRPVDLEIPERILNAYALSLERSSKK